MRQSSSCLPWEPARCSTYSRSQSECNASEPKGASRTTYTTSKTQCSARPTARQWVSWNENNMTPSSDINSGYKYNQDQPQSLASSDLQSSTSLDNLKALPTRFKANHSTHQIKQAHRAAEENKLRNTSKSQTENVNYSSLLVNKAAPAIEVNVARSRCHPRRRPCADAVQNTTPKLRRDTDCTEAIVRLIVFFSTKLVHTIWSQASATPKSSKDFNGAGVLPLQVFIQETLRRSKTSYSTLQVALFYLMLLRPHVRPCQATQQQYTPGCRALQCGRRMFLTALILASKYLQDRNYSARAWSKISGLPVAEINENERHYLELIKYNLHMSKETFENWSRVVLSICKASGQGPFGSRPDSPPSSPDASSCSVDSEQPGSSDWWSCHLRRLSPEVVKTSKATEEYLSGLAPGAAITVSSLSLDTPPSSPESLEDVLSDHSSPIVLPPSSTGQMLTSGQASELVQSPAAVGSVPSRPLPPNLPTPQTTPRYDSAFNFSRQSSHSDLRCRASLQALAGMDKQAVTAANLKTCPPPKPRHCGASASGACHPLRESVESTAVSWMSSPESSFSDSASNTTRSRSSSISSVSSVWSVPGNCSTLDVAKQLALPHTESRPSLSCAQPQVRANIGSYSFYHPVGNMHSIPEDVDARGQDLSAQCKQTRCSGELQSDKMRDLSDNHIARLLASLSSESDGQIEQRSDPAAISKSTEQNQPEITVNSCKKHKRNRSSKEDNFLQAEVRQFLWNEQSQVCVEDDNKPTSHVEASDKQAQYPLQQWAHAKKPVPNALHNKRIALQHSSPEQKNAPELAAEFLRQSVTVM